MRAASTTRGLSAHVVQRGASISARLQAASRPCHEILGEFDPVHDVITIAHAARFARWQAPRRTGARVSGRGGRGCFSCSSKR